MLELDRQRAASLDTLSELAAALADYTSFASTIQNKLNIKVDASTTYAKTEANCLLSAKA